MWSVLLQRDKHLELKTWAHVLQAKDTPVLVLPCLPAHPQSNSTRPVPEH